MRIFLVLALLVLPIGLQAQSPDETLNQRSSLVRGAVHGAQTYLERVAADSTLSPQARRDLNQLRGRLRALETHVLVLDVIARRYVLPADSLPVDTLPPPADTVPPIVVVPPDTTEVFARTVANEVLTGDVLVPAGQKWLIGKNVRLVGNLRTDAGTIAFRPGSSLKIDGNPARYLGGGMGYVDADSLDYGIWIGPQGTLDIRGTPKTGWGHSPASDWLATDSIWIAPTGVKDHTPRRWYPGDTIPQISDLAPPAELLNVTRDITIEGPGHIFINSSLPQTIEYVTLRGMGITRPNQGLDGLTTGRYALHWHRAGQSGSIVRGVAAIHSRGRVFVPHGSHGITFTDVVSVDSWGEAMWWDLGVEGDRSSDISIDRLAVSGVSVPRTVTGQTSMVPGVQLAGGTNLSITNSVVSGVSGGKLSTGFDWPSVADNFGEAIWTFKGNVAHNNEGAGIRLWFNNCAEHELFRTLTYRNGYGIENGAYHNAIYYEGLTLIEDTLFAQASGGGTGPKCRTGRPQSFVDVTAPTLLIGHVRLPAGMYQHYVDCRFDRVRLNGRQFLPWMAHFDGCNVTPQMIEWPAPMLPALEGSEVQIRGTLGNWDIRVAGQRPIVKNLTIPNPER